MSTSSRIVSGLIASTLAITALAGSVQPSDAKKLTPAEAALLAGVGGLIVGAAIASPPRYGGGYHHGRSAWERHVDRCYARYRTYDERSDTFIGYDGNEHYCRL